MRGATLQPFPAIVFPDDFNPRSPCGERRRIRPGQTHDGNISIHAPRAGSDTTEIDIAVRAMLFQSTPPVRGATIFPPRRVCRIDGFQSTPPVRGATGRRGGAAADMGDFNPRPPCGGRLCAELGINISDRISIHAPRAGGDLWWNRLTSR